MTVIDVHTHMFTTKWLELLKKNGGIYNIQVRPDGHAPAEEAARKPANANNPTRARMKESYPPDAARPRFIQRYPA